MRGFARRAPALALSALAAVLTGPSAHGAQTQFGLASRGAIKLTVRESGGLIRVTQAALLAAGLDPAVDPANLRLFADGVEQAVVFRGNADAAFSSDEAIEFYGRGRDTLWTDARTYWLVSDGPGARIAALPPAASPAADTPAAFTCVASVVQHLHYLGAVTNGDDTNFFGAAVSPTAATQMLPVAHLETAQATDAVLRVSLQGVTATAHQVNVSLNGVLLGGCAFANPQNITCAFAAPGILEGANQVMLQATGGSADFSAVERLELAYPHSYLADDDALLLTAPAAATRVTIGGFSTADVRVLDVTDPVQPLELAVAVTTVGGATSASFTRLPIAASSPRPPWRPTPPPAGINRMKASS